MKTRLEPLSALLGLTTALSLFLLLSSGQGPATEAAAAEEPALIGRYQLAVGYDMNTVIVLDTTDGATWVWRDPSETSAWQMVPLSEGPERD